ncbi:MAG: PmoA family protein [bacterium]|nr:PmoA family protein [bacterium]
MSFQVTDILGDRLTIHSAGRHLLTYVYQPKTAALESPRPYFHPLTTLAGDTVTIFRPHDHRWHYGLSFVLPHVNGENFWGGVTYVHGEGYIQLDNNGRQEHAGWIDPPQAWDDFITIAQRVMWYTHDDEKWLREQRLIVLNDALMSDDYWGMALSFHLQNVSKTPLEIGSPTTQGRPKAGYGGLFWRGVRDFTGGSILLDGERAASGDQDHLMGERASWLAFVGSHDQTDRASTVILVDSVENPRHPTQWFSRATPYACASASFQFDTPYLLEPDQTLSLSYHVFIASGAWSAARIQELVDTL